MGNKILVDGNSIGYAAHNARELKQNGRPVQAIFFTLKMIKAVVELYGNHCDELIVLWDTPAKWRYAIHPEYKGKRDDDPVKRASRKAYKEQVPLIRKALSLLGVKQMIARDEEADDLAAALVHNREPGEVIVLVSGDMDWAQLVTDGVIWYDPREEGKTITYLDFEAKTGFATPVLFSQAKAVLGDSSDNIKGIDGIGEKCLPLLFKYYRSIPGFFEGANIHAKLCQPSFEKGELPEELSRWRTKLNEFAFGNGLQVFKRNMQLMNLLSKRHRSTEILDKTVSVVTPYDEEAFTDFCAEFAFMSITRKIPEWRAAFEKFAAAEAAVPSI